MGKNKAIKLSDKIKKWFAEIWYGEKFEHGYTYRKVYSPPIPICNNEPSFKLFERIIDYWVNDGWVQHSDIKTTFSRLYIWIKKNRNID